MNQAVAQYRQAFPNDPRPDDEITVDLANRFPDEFNTFPDAVSDYKRILGGTDTDADQSSAIGAFARGVGRNVIPAVTTAAGAVTAGALASEGGPAAIPAAIAGGTGGGIVGEKINKALDIGQDQSQIKADEEQHPIASKMGEFLGQIPAMFGAGGLGKKVATGLIDQGISEVAAKRIGNLAENAIGGAIMSGSGAAQQAAEGNAPWIKVPEEMVKGAVTMGPVGLIPHAASVLGAIGWKAPTDAAVLGLSNALYDHFVSGKDIDPKQLSHQIGTDIPGFMLMNGLSAVFGKTPWMPTNDGKITSEPAQEAKAENQDNSIPPLTTMPTGEELAADKAREDALKQQFPNAGAQTSTAEPPPGAVTAPTEAAPPAPITPPAPVEPESSNQTPEWVADQMKTLAAPLEKNGVADKIEDLSAAGKTAKEIVQTLGLDVDQVRSVRNLRKIPSLDEPEDFQEWLAKRKNQSALQQARAAAAQTTTGANEETASEMPVQPQAGASEPTPKLEGSGNAGAVPPAVNKQVAQEPEKSGTLVHNRIEEFDSALEAGRGQLVQGEQSAAGQKNAALFVETQDPKAIFSDTTAKGENGKVDNKLSPKTVAMLSPDGNTVVEGTAYRSGTGDGRNKVTMPDGPRRFVDLVKEGWKPLASMKGEPRRDYAVTYSRDQWNQIADHMRGRMNAAKGTADAVAENLEAAKEFGRERGDEHPTGDETVEAHENAGGATEAPVEVRGFTKDHAGAIFDALDGLHELSGDDRDKAFVEGIANDRRALSAIKLAVKGITDATGVAPDVAFESLRQEIYDNIEKSGSKRDAFTQSFLPGKGTRDNAKAGTAGNDHSRPEAPAGNAGGGQGAEAGANTSRERVESAAADVDTNPTEAEKKAGNYRKGHVTIDGLDITIENPKGSARSGTDANGKPWSVEMPAHYGYVKGTEGIDGDHVDVYIGDHPDSDKVFVIDQINPDTKKFDEHKAMLGFNSREEAVAAYVRAFSDNKGPARIGEVTEMPKEDFKDWVHEGDTNRPLSYGKQFAASSLARASDRGVSEHVAASADIAKRFNDIRDAAQANGLPVDIVRRLREGGRYSPREVTLAVADPLNPSHDNITLLLHEIGHDVFRMLGLPPDTEAAFHRAIAKLSNPEGFKVSLFPGADTKAATAEEVLVERAARNLNAEGFNPAHAMDMASRLVDYAKRLYFRAAIAIQRGLLGDGHVNPELAQRYFEERVKAFLTGNDNPMNFISFIGGAKLRAEQRGDTFEPSGGRGVPAGVFDYDAGMWQYRRAGGPSLADMDYNANVARYSLDRGVNNERANEHQNERQAYAPERLPPEAEQAIGEGHLRAATDVARGVHQAIAETGATQPTRGREAAELNRQLKPREELELLDWAKKNGLMLDAGEFNKHWNDQGNISGAEHDVYIDDKGVVWKRNSGLMHGTWLEYFHRLALHNALFPETAMHFHGLMEHEGNLYAVVSQKAVEADHGASREEVESEMTKRGFVRTRADNYYNPRTGVIVEDLHDENAVINKHGRLVIFDPIPLMAKAHNFAEGGTLAGQPRPEVRYSDRGIARRTVNDPHIISPDIDSPAQVQEDIAAFNELGDMHRAAYKTFMSAPDRPPGYSYEQFLHDFLDVDATTDAKISRRNAELEANGHPKTDPTLRPHDLLSEASQTRAANTAYRWLSTLKTWMAEKAGEHNEFLKDAREDLDSMNARLHDQLADYTDMSKQLANAKEELRRIHDRFLGDTAATMDKAKRLGVLSQVIRQLDSRMGSDPDISKQYRTIVEKQYRKLTGDTSGSFVDTLQKIAGLGIDWKNVPTKDAVDAISKIIAPSDPELKSLENRALAAMTVAFAKRNAVAMDSLKLARSDALDERAQVTKILKDAIGASRDALPRAKELARKLPKLGATTERMLDRIEDLKDERNKQLDDIKRAGEFLDMHRAVQPLLNDRMTAMERQIGARFQDWEANNGNEYFVAPSDKATDAQVEASKVAYDIRAPRETIIDHIQKNKAWMDAVPEDKRGALWGTVQEHTRKLEAQLGFQDHEMVIKRNWMANFLGNIVDKLEGTGLPELASAARRIRKAVTEQGAEHAGADNAGIKFDAAEGRAMKALGMDKVSTARFRRLFLDGALSFAEKRSDLRARFKTDAEAFNALLPELRKHFLSDPGTRDVVERAGGWKALENYYRATYENMDHVMGVMRKLGGKVEEVLPNGQKVYRNPIGATFFTAMRMLSGDGLRMYHELRDNGWAGTDTVGRLDAEKIAARYAADRASLDQDLQKRFTQQAWLDFVRPLAKMVGRSNFEAPKGKDGIAPLAARSDVIKAFDDAQGNALKFAENLYDLTGKGSAEPKEQFIGRTLQTFQDFFDTLHSTQQGADYSARQGVPTPGRLLQDARVSESWPKEWLDYAAYGRRDMHGYVDQLTQQAAYGRNLDGIRREFAAAQEVLKAKARTFERIVQDVEDANPTKSRRSLRDAIKAECVKRGESYTALSQARDNLRMVAGEQESFEKTLMSQSDVAMEMRPWLQLISSTAGIAVQGPGTAMLPMTAWGQAFGKLGLGQMAIGTFLRSIKGFAGEAFNTMAQAFHLQMRLNADSTARRMANGDFDPDSQRKFMDVLTAIMHETKDVDGAVSRNVLRVSRLMRAFASSGIGSGDAVTLKPQAAFSTVVNQIRFGLIDAWTHNFEDMISRAVDYFKDPKNAADFQDNKFQFTDGKQLGYGKGMFGIGDETRAFNYLRQTLARNGMDLETLARDAIKRGDGNLIDDAQFRSLASMVINEVTLEAANLQTRPSRMLSNPVLRIASPLVGWSVAKAHDNWEAWRNPDMTETSQNAFKAFRAGALPYLAVVPFGMALAWLRSQYEEKAIGKKANRAGATDSFAGLLDASARMGTFGLFGELANAGVNESVEKPFSVDSRIFAISSALNFIRAAQTFYQEGGNPDYQSVVRPGIQALGGAGMLQYMQLINHALSLDNSEARVTARINALNWLRVEGRQAGLDVRTTGVGPDTSMSNPVKPYVGQMVLAAYANDSAGFRAAYTNALQAAKDSGVLNGATPQDFVKRQFAYDNPLRVVFKTEPSPEQVRALIGRMDPDGQQAVSTALRLYNGYAEQLGIKPDEGKEPRATGVQYDLQSIRRAAFGGSAPVASIADLRKLAAGY